MLGACGKHICAGAQAYSAKFEPVSTATRLPIKAFAASLSPVATTIPEASLPIGQAWSTRVLTTCSMPGNKGALSLISSSEWVN